MPQPTRDHKGLTITYVALGSNATSSSGSPESTLRAAKQAISCDSVKVLAESRLFRTPAFPKGAGPDFANAVIRAETSMSRDAFLAHLHSVEKAFGRVRTTRWGIRTLDLDMLDFGGVISPDASTLKRWIDLPLERQAQDTPQELLLPHPRLHERSFVLIPMADIAPEWTHPVLGLSVSQMVEARPDAEKHEVVPLDTPF